MDANVTTFNAKRKLLDAALTAAMDRAAAEPMRWGVDDCALWCANTLREAVGYDAAANFRGRYKTQIGARRVLGKGGLATALRVAARRHGWHLTSEGGEQEGDIGIAVLAGVASTVICRAPGWFVGRNTTGFTAVRTADVRIIWSVI